MVLICEICGKEIKYPNYIDKASEGMYESFYECAKCNLEFLIDRYMDFKEDFPNDSKFHQIELMKINTLTFELSNLPGINN